MKPNGFPQWSTIRALELLGDIEDGERAAERLGLADLAQLLKSAKQDLAEKIAQADHRRRRRSGEVLRFAVTGIVQPSKAPTAANTDAAPSSTAPTSAWIVDARHLFGR